MNLPEPVFLPDPERHGLTPMAFEINLSGTPAMDKLWEYISIAKKNPKSFKDNLAGNILTSSMLNDTDNWVFKNICVPLIHEYKIAFQSFENLQPYTRLCFSKDVPYMLDKFWVNFQKQHEFNPIHNHAGLFSFVIFMKIPTDFREQHEIPFVKESNAPKASNFEFVYTDPFGRPTGYSYNLDPSCEGKMLFFPAELNHLVYPFYNCEEERITISGNIIYDL